MTQSNSQSTDTETVARLQSRMASAFCGAIVTSLLMTPFDVVKTRQQSQTLVTKQPLHPRQRRTVNYWVPRNARPQQIEVVLTRLCAPSTTRAIGTESASLRASASLCLCSDALVFDAQGRPVDVGQSGITKTCVSTGEGSVGAAWRQLYRDLVAVPQAAKAGLWKRLGLAPRIERVAGERVTGTLAGMRYIARTEGVRTLWRGLSPTLVASGPSTMIYFVGYDYLRAWMGVRMKASTVLAPYEQFASLVAGCVARTAAASVISPLELVRTRMQSSATHDLRTVLRGVSSEIRHGGPSTLWRGLVPTLWRDVPFSAIYWFGYEQWSQRVFAPIFNDRQHTSGASDTLTRLMTSFFSGAASGIVAATITTPFDVAKTRRQIEQHANPKAHIAQHRTFASMLRHIVANEGARGLFAGLAPRLMKIAPSCAIMISSYELGKIVLSS